MHAIAHQEPLRLGDRPGPSAVPQIDLTCHTPATFSPIGQVDGNVSPPSLSSTPGLPNSNIIEPAIISAGDDSNSSTRNAHFQYTLNNLNQTKRLLENTNRDVFTIRYNK